MQAATLIRRRAIPLAGVALLDATYALTHARAGNSTACHRYLDRAERIFRAPQADDPLWMQYVTETQLAKDTGTSLFYLAAAGSRFPDDTLLDRLSEVTNYPNSMTRRKASASGSSPLPATPSAMSSAPITPPDRHSPSPAQSAPYESRKLSPPWWRARANTAATLRYRTSSTRPSKSLPGIQHVRQHRCDHTHPRRDPMETETFGRTLRRLRQQAGLTQTCLAKQVGWSQSQVCRAENDRSLPSADIAKQLDTVLRADGELYQRYHEAVAERQARTTARRVIRPTRPPPPPGDRVGWGCRQRRPAPCRSCPPHRRARHLLAGAGHPQ